MQSSFFSVLRCQKCGNMLQQEAGSFLCISCKTTYQRIQGAIDFLKKPPLRPLEDTNQNDFFVYRLKNFFKRYHTLYYILVRIVGPLFIGRKRGKDFAALFPRDALILNLGSGPKIISDAVINIDATPFHGVALLADITCLPIRDSSIDAVICECVLEHVSEPTKVVHEIERILKPGGQVYISVPFIDGYHASPDDYYRWTASGLRHALNNFSEKEFSLAWGPTSGLVIISAYWLGILLSFGSVIVSQMLMLFFLLLFSPLKLLDIIFKYYPASQNIATGFYFIGSKK